MSALIIQNNIVHYEVLGRGRPVIFLHSWVGSWRQWIVTMQTVSSAYRCYAIDFWGFGDSAKPGGRYSLEDQVELLEAFIEKLGIRKVAVIGHGLGALVAANFAAKYPKSVDRLMLAGIPLEPGMVNDRMRTAGIADLSLWLLSGLPGVEPVKLEAEKADLQAVRESLETIELTRLQELSDTYQIPCLLVYSDKDPVIQKPAYDPEILLSRLTHQIELEGSTHHPMLTLSGKFDRLVIDFLALKSGESPQNLQLKDEWKRRFR